MRVSDIESEVDTYAYARDGVGNVLATIDRDPSLLLPPPSMSLSSSVMPDVQGGEMDSMLDPLLLGTVPLSRPLWISCPHLHRAASVPLPRRSGRKDRPRLHVGQRIVLRRATLRAPPDDESAMSSVRGVRPLRTPCLRCACRTSLPRDAPFPTPSTFLLTACWWNVPITIYGELTPVIRVLPVE